MSDSETTLPPRQPNTLGNVLRRAWKLAKAYPDISLPLAFLVGVLVGAALL